MANCSDCKFYRQRGLRPGVFGTTGAFGKCQLLTEVMVRRLPKPEKVSFKWSSYDVEPNVKPGYLVVTADGPACSAYKRAKTAKVKEAVVTKTAAKKAARTSKPATQKPDKAEAKKPRGKK